MSLKFQILRIIAFLFLCSGNYASVDVTRGAILTTDYRYGYQGQYAETDPETGFTHFEAREFDSRLGRWMIPDPARQHWSPYLGMGNNPVSGVDADERLFTRDETEKGSYIHTTNNGNPNTAIVPDNKL